MLFSRWSLVLIACHPICETSSVLQVPLHVCSYSLTAGTWVLRRFAVEMKHRFAIFTPKQDRKEISAISDGRRSSIENMLCLFAVLLLGRLHTWMGCLFSSGTMWLSQKEKINISMHFCSNLLRFNNYFKICSLDMNATRSIAVK